MGVHKLWDLLTATALPLRVESLFGKVCCVDASFWISHCLASESNMRHGGDIIAVFFLRICYLLDKGIKPVFVFDGKSPFAKLKTILKRKLISHNAVTNHKLLAFKMLATQLKNSNKYKIPSTISNDIIDNDNDNDNILNSDNDNYQQDIIDVDNNTHLQMNNNNSNNQDEFRSIDNIQYDRKLNTSDEVNLLDLFPEEFLNKSEEDFEEEFQMLKDCDFLSAKTKYDLINSVRDNIIQKDRERFTSLKGKIDEYSDHQIKSYMRDVKINNELDQLKRELNESYLHLYQPKTENYKINNQLSGEIYDYNEYFDRKYSYNKYNDYDNEYRIGESSNNYNNQQDKSTSSSIYYDKDYNINTNNNNNNNNKNNKIKKEEIDESIYACDEMIFGEEMLSGINNNYENENKEEKKDDNIKEEKENENKELIKQYKEKEDKKENNKQINPFDNDYFLELHRKYFNTDAMYNQQYNDTDNSNDEDNDNYNNNSNNYNNNDHEDEDEHYDDNEYEYEQDIDTDIKPTRHVSEHTESGGVVIGQKHKYYEDVQSLLDRFGVPYIVAPSEAESQCAYMNMVGDCYAVISDDSDSLVFGAKKLLKNFYNDNVFELYTSDRIERELGITRQQLALIAVICGSDYTNGVKGIGIVNALEVIKAYPKFEDLYEFKKWATSDCNVDTATYDECMIRREYKNKHINYRIHWTFSSDFPNREAYDLFLNPKVTSEYKLEWEKPNKELLIEYMSKKSSLEMKQVVECLKVLFSKKSQQFIMEDMMPEMRTKEVKKTAVKNYRINMNANLSAFRNVLSNIKGKIRYNIKSNRVHTRNHTLSKIRSKRMVDSIKVIKRRSRKNKNNNL